MRIHKAAAATLVTLVGAGSLIAATMTPALARPAARPAASITITSVAVKPSTNLVDKQSVKVTVTDAKGKTFNGTPTLYFAECSPLAVTKLSESYCDTTNIATVSNPTGSTATANVTIHTTGAGDFAASQKAAVCGAGAALKCIILVVNSTDTSTVTSFGDTTISFKDLRTATTTKVASKKTVKAKGSLTFKATTTHSKGSTKPTGSVVFKDNGKKIGKVKLSTTGKATLKHKFKKAGKQHITAIYSGDNTYKPSTGKETITVKK